MKKMIKIHQIIIILIGLVFFCSVNAYSGDYVGDLCWNFNTDRETSGLAKLGVTHIGGGHFLCSGVISVNDPTKPEFPAYGNIEYVNEQYVMTLSLAGIRAGSMGIDMIKIILNPSTLNGTMQRAGIYSEDIESEEGTVQFTGCP